MTLGKTLKTEHRRNALYIRIRNIYTITGEYGSHTREVSYLPDFYVSPLFASNGGTGLKVCGTRHMGDLKQPADSNTDAEVIRML